MRLRMDTSDARANDDLTLPAFPNIKSQNIGGIIMALIFFIDRAHALCADENNRKRSLACEFTKRRFRRFEDLALRDRDLLLEIF